MVQPHPMKLSLSSLLLRRTNPVRLLFIARLVLEGQALWLVCIAWNTSVSHLQPSSAGSGLQDQAPSWDLNSSTWTIWTVKCSTLVVKLLAGACKPELTVTESPMSPYQMRARKVVTTKRKHTMQRRRRCKFTEILARVLVWRTLKELPNSSVDKSDQRQIICIFISSKLLEELVVREGCA